MPQDFTGVLPDNAVEHRALAILLDELGKFVLGDAEILPVDDRIGAVGDSGHTRRSGIDADLPADDLRSVRVGV